MFFLHMNKTDSLCVVFWFLDILSMEGAYLIDGKFQCHISFIPYTVCRMLAFIQKLNMIKNDFHSLIINS